MTTGRICLECLHCYVDSGERGYSDLTPSSPWVFECRKNHRFGTNMRDHEGDKRTMLEDIRKAETCPDFQAEKDAAP